MKRKSDEDAEGVSPVKTRSSLGIVGNEADAEQLRCFFCEKPGGSLHRASSFNLDRDVRWCALELQDCKLLAERSLCDMPAIDVYYHNMCLVALYNRARSVKKSPD